MPILDIQRRVHEIGRIRLGEKDDNRPRALSTFRFTSPRQDLLTRAAELFGGTVTPWNSQWQVVTDADALDVLVPPEDVSFSQWWEQWTAGGCSRRCDGVREAINDEPCPCVRDGVRVCEPITRLSVILPAFAVFGVWRVESSSWYAAGELQSSVGLALQLAERSGALSAATLRIERRAVKRPNEPARRFVVPVLDVRLSAVHLDADTLGSREKAIGGQTDGPTSLDVVGLPAPTPRIDRGAQSPPPAPVFGEHDHDEAPTLPTPPPSITEGPALSFAPVAEPPEPTVVDELAKMRRACFAQVRDVLKTHDDGLDADTLRYGLAVIETAKRRDAPVTSWNDLTRDELISISTRLVELQRGQLRAEASIDGNGVVFTTTTGRTARVFIGDDGAWTFNVTQPT